MLGRVVGVLSRDRTAVYPWFVLIGLSFGWLVTASLGAGWTDLSGAVVGNDFLAFYSTSELIAESPEVDPYDLEVTAERQRRLIPQMDPENLVPYLNPPVALFWYAPLHLAPYGVSLLIWTVLGVLAWVAAHHLLSRTSPILRRWGLKWMILVSLLFSPTLMWLFNGQATGFVFVLLAGSYAALVHRRELLAGVILGLLLFKPQLAIGLALPLLVAGRWRALAGGAGSVGTQLAVSYWLWPDQYGYFASASAAMPQLLVDPSYKLWGIQSVFGFWHLLIGGVSPGGADVLTAVSSLALILGLVVVWWREPWLPETDRWKSAIAGTLLIALTIGLHLFIYDLALLMLPFWIVVGVIRGLPRTDPALDGGPVLVWVSLIWCLAFAGPYLTMAVASASTGAGL